MTRDPGRAGARARDVALVVVAGWLVVQNLALLVMVPRATLTRAAAEVAAWVVAHPALALALAAVPMAVAFVLATGMALGAVLARAAGRGGRKEESHA